MARRKYNTTQGFRGYVDTTAITKSERDNALATWGLDGTALDAIQGIVEAGYTFSIRYDGRRNAYIAQLYGKASKENAGWGLSSFAGDIETAVALTLHKHIVHFASEKWEYDDPDMWG